MKTRKKRPNVIPVKPGGAWWSHDRIMAANQETASGVRWASNILVELLGNHHAVIDPRAREQMKIAVAALGEVAQHLEADRCERIRG